MARYLLASYPITFWTPDGTVPGYIQQRGVWVPNRGYFCTAHQGVSSTASLGWLQFDGTFMKVGPSNADYYSVRFHEQYWNTDPEIAYQWYSLRHTKYLYANRDSNIRMLGGYYGISGTVVMESQAKTDLDRKAYLACWYRETDPANGNVQSWRMCRVKEGQNGFFYTRWRGMSDFIDTLANEPIHPTISKYDEDLYYCIFPSGRWVLFNFDTETVIFKDKYIDDFYNDPNIAYTQTSYVREYNIFMTLVWKTPVDATGHYPMELRIYANEGVATSISVPANLSTVQKLTVTEFEATVTGAQGDPVEDKLVDWTITAGDGTLLQTQSKTDIDGKATVEYLGPTTAPGSVTIEVEAVI